MFALKTYLVTTIWFLNSISYPKEPGIFEEMADFRTKLEKAHEPENNKVL